MINLIYIAFLQSSGVCTDTRRLKSNALFFALKGENFNGNDYVLRSLEEGCLAAIADERRAEFISNPKIHIVENSQDALQDLAKHHRQFLKIPIIALTGSNGKTTTKELLKVVLSEQYECYATHGNLNNHIGVPLSLLEITDKHEIAVIEMGANHQHEIEQLCEIADPDYGLITNIGLAHLEGFGGEEGVYKGKKELFDYLAKNESLVFVNTDDSKILEAALHCRSVVRYGSNSPSSIQGVDFTKEGRLSFTWWTASEPEIKITVNTQLSGSYNFSNALAAVAVGEYFGISALKIKKAIERYTPSNNRSQLLTTIGGNTLIVDCYNANPSSMFSAINSLSDFSLPNKVFILGDMMELGPAGEKEHQKVVNQLSSSILAKKILVGEYFSGLSSSLFDESFTRFKTTEEAALYLKDNPLKDSIILLKGSRKMKLEQLIERL